MCTTRIVASLVAVFLFLALIGGHGVEAQEVRVEVGGGWAIPSSSVDMRWTVEGEEGRPVPAMDTRSGRHVYAAAGLLWRLSSNFDLKGRARAQQSWIRGNVGDLTSLFQGCRDGGCSVSNEPDGRLWAATIEGQIILTSVGRIEPYFLVGLGVVRTTIEGATVRVPVEDSPDAVVRYSDIGVTDAGGDVGFGALMEVAGNLSLHAEVRATGSLPGAKENAVTTFPFSLGLSYGF